jgi:hypothetical protein
MAGLKFSDALPRHLAVATLATRLADLDNAAAVLAEPVRFERLFPIAARQPHKPLIYFGAAARPTNLSD